MPKVLNGRGENNIAHRYTCGQIRGKTTLMDIVHILYVRAYCTYMYLFIHDGNDENVKDNIIILLFSILLLKANKRVF
jgi:hypothetical protein